jgi:molecular chaperone GrpE
VEVTLVDPEASPPASTELIELQEKLGTVEAKLKETHERMLRTAADFDNYRKRALKDREETQRVGAERMLKDFLPILDNLERALEHAKSSQDFDSLREGVSMTRRLFEDTLAKHGVTSVVALGELFDPRLHDALQHVETTDVAPNHVVTEVAKGYMLKDRLMRPALVVVSKEPQKGDRDSEGEASVHIAGPKPGAAGDEMAPSD